MNTGAFPHSYNHREEYFLKPTTTPINLPPRNINTNINTSHVHHPLKESFHQQQATKTPQKVSSYQNSFPQLDPTNNIPSLNVKRSTYDSNKPDENDSYEPQKKVKTENNNTKDIFESFMEGFNSKDTNDHNLFEGLITSSYESIDVKNELEPYVQDPIKDFWSEISNPKEHKQLLTEIKSAVELLKDDFTNKHEAIKDRNYYLSINFEFPPETPERSESISEEPSPSSNDLDENSREALIPHERKKGYQIIKNGLEAISESDIQRLDPAIYLNDNLINFYIKLIENGFLSEERKKKCYFFNTYFMSQMGRLFAEVGKDLTQFDYIYDKMKKWTKKVNLFEKDFLFIPVNDNDHWNVIVLCYPYRLFSRENEFPFVVFLDSLCRMDNIYSSMLFQFFSREVKAKMPNEFTFLRMKSYKYNASSFPFYQHMVPKQSNGHDCGLYFLQFMEMFSEDETYIMNRIEDVYKMRWFPRKLIEDKREDIKKIIDNLRVNKFEAIDEYLQKRSQILSDYKNDNTQFDTFNPRDCEKAVIKTYAGRFLTEQDKRCLALDFYFLGTLDYDEIVRKK